MLFESLIQSLLKQSTTDAIAQASKARKEEAYKRLCYYNDGQLDYVRDQLEANFAQGNKMTALFINLVRKIVNLLAMVYMSPPKRALSGAVDMGAQEAIWNGTALDIKLKQANRLCKLLKTILIKVVWRNGRLDLDLLTPDLLDTTWGDTPEDLQSVLTTIWPESGKREEIEYSLWTPEQFRRLDYKGDTIESQPNPYGTLPFVACWDRPVISDFWQSGGDDLVCVQEAVNEKLCDLVHVLRMQGYGQAVAKGLEETTKLQLGPGSVVTLPKDGDFTFAATQAPIQDIISAIEFLIKQVAVANGLPASSLTSDPTDQSGVSLIVSNRELEELRRDDIELWRGYEQKLFQVMKQVWNVHASKKIPESARLQIDFADPEPKVSQEVQARTWDALLGMGVISEVDIVMARNPDLKTREDALAFLLQIQQERNALNERII